MTSWYPDDLSRRPLQISFHLVRHDNGAFQSVHETELVNHLDDLAEFVDHDVVDGRDAVIFEVSISIVYQGRELLGADGSVETITGVTGPNARRDDGQPVNVLYGPGRWYSFHEHGEFYHYRYLVDRQPIHDLMLPADETDLEWFLMNSRISRLKIELGDRDERRVAEADLAHIGHDGLFAYTLTAPLDQILTQPRPHAIANRL